MDTDLPSSRLPPLNAIRAFEAVGRLLSYTAAARELSVTTSAVSHHVRGLEEYLGLSLVRRSDHQIFLTSAGEKYFMQISQGLTQLSVATGALLRAKGARVLRVSVVPTLATWWLVPRLDRFLAACPDISLELSASPNRVDFARGEFDVAIRYARRIPSGFHASVVGKNEVFPVCSPRILEGPAPLRTAADLKHHVLIDTQDSELMAEKIGRWEGWLSATRNPPVTGTRQLYLGPRGLMLQAVAQGLGVGLARTLMAAEAINAGQLVCPFGPALPLQGNYFVVCPDANAKEPEVVAFRDWVIAEARVSESMVKIPGEGQDDRAPVHLAGIEVAPLPSSEVLRNTESMVPPDGVRPESA